jgi:Domain of unknown function (DUF4166)
MASANRLSRYLTPAPCTSKLIDDHRFRALLPDEDWGRLPLAIWRRFSMRLADGKTIVYVGEIDQARMSFAGWCLAQLVRLIGAPLPTSADAGVPMIVAVTEDAASGGQIWTRITGRRHGFPQVISSCKRFAGPTGLEEYVGCGVSMALTISVAHEALAFRSAGYFLRIGRLSWRLPDWLTPGDLIVTHTDLGGEAFRFTLEITHARLGRLMRQSAVFKEATS